jgi:preprotein translocase subunit SecG
MVAVHVLASIFLIAVILLQAGKGSGMSEGFGGGAMQNMFGSSANTVMTKVTAACAIIFIFTSLTLTIMTTRRSKSLIELERGKVSDIVTGQKVKARGESPAAAPMSQQPVAVAAAQAPAQPAEEAKKTVTVKEVKIDPVTGKEIVVKEEKMTPEEAAARNNAK